MLVFDFLSHCLACVSVEIWISFRIATTVISLHQVLVEKSGTDGAITQIDNGILVLFVVFSRGIVSVHKICYVFDGILALVVVFG